MHPPARAAPARRAAWHPTARRTRRRAGRPSKDEPYGSVLPHCTAGRKRRRWIVDLNIRTVIASGIWRPRMDHRKKAMILDRAIDLYTLLRDILGMFKGDDRVTQLDQATERY